MCARVRTRQRDTRCGGAHARECMVAHTQSGGSSMDVRAHRRRGRLEARGAAWYRGHRRRALPGGLTTASFRPSMGHVPAVAPSAAGRSVSTAAWPPAPRQGVPTARSRGRGATGGRWRPPLPRHGSLGESCDASMGEQERGPVNVRHTRLIPQHPIRHSRVTVQAVPAPGFDEPVGTFPRSPEQRSHPAWHCPQLRQG